MPEVEDWIGAKRFGELKLAGKLPTCSNQCGYANGGQDKQCRSPEMLAASGAEISTTYPRKN